jgi:hypothetical protein
LRPPASTPRPAGWMQDHAPDTIDTGDQGHAGGSGPGTPKSHRPGQPEMKLEPASGRRLPCRIVLPLILLALLALAAPAGAQYFGKNKVQYDKFDWSVLETEHFHVYFYPAEEEAARDAARMAERSYAKLSKLLDHEVKQPIPLILYASHTDFQQTNALSGLIDEGTGGVTEFLKRRVILPFTGSYGELDHVLTHELVHAFQVDVLFGDKSLLSGRMGASPPLWFMEGMAEYLSIGEIDNHTRMWLRDGALEGYLTSLPELGMTGDIRVYRYGQAIFQFIDERYGTQKIAEMLQGVSRRGGLDRTVQSTLGISVEDLSKQWTEQMRKTYLPTIAEYDQAEVYGRRLTDHGNDLSRINLVPSISPDGSQMVFLSDRGLFNDLYLASAIDGKVLKKLVSGERSSSFESLRYLQTALSWSPDGKLITFAAKVGGEDAIYLFAVESKEVVRRLTFGLDGILSPSFSPDGSRLVFVGLDGGRSDLFITDVEGQKLERLTQDRFADRDPAWSPDGRYIAFTTDRGPRTNFRTLEFGEFKVATYDLETEQIRVLPGQAGKNVSPQWSPDGTKIALVSDRTGISNIFMVEVASAESFQITNVLTGVSGITESSPPITWSANGKRLLFTSFEQGGFNIYAIKDPLDLLEGREPSAPAVIAQAESAPPAPRRLGGGSLEEEGSSDLLTAAGELPAAAVPVTPPDSVLARVAVAVDSAAALVAVDSAAALVAADSAAALVAADSAAALVAAAPDSLLGAQVPGAAPDSLAASGAAAGTADDEDEDTVAVTYRPPAPDGSTFRIRDYEVSFSPDVVAGAGGFAPGVGVAGQFALGLSDVLGNHHIMFSANVFGSISESDLFLTYYNLERRSNWGVTLFQYRNDYLSFYDNAVLRVDREVFRGAEGFMWRPFSKFRRLELAMQGAFVDRSFVDPDITESGTGVEGITQERVFFLKPSVAFVTDTILYGSTGPIAGARNRLSVAHSFGDLSYTTVGMDLRRYVNIRQRHVFAVRALGASSFGGTPQSFAVGGPWTVRGWSFEQFHGTNIGVLNLEYRFPLVEQFRFGWPLPMEFRGIVGVLFFDAGTAFDRHDEWQPFAGTGGLFRLEDTFASYGIGARINLGFLILRWDLAQRTDLDRNIGSAISTLAVGAAF